MPQRIALITASLLLTSCDNFLVPNVPPEPGTGQCAEFDQVAEPYTSSGYPVRCGPQEETPH